MPALSAAELRDAIRELAKVDKRHSFLRPKVDGGVTEGWFDWHDRHGLTILVERNRDGVPLVGAMLKYPEECPEDRTALLRIWYWLAKLDRPDELDAAFRASIQSIHDTMETLGVQRVWGAVPTKADHLTEHLVPIATAAKCETAEVPETAGNLVYYFGNGDEVNTYVQAVSP